MNARPDTPVRRSRMLRRVAVASTVAALAAGTLATTAAASTPDHRAAGASHVATHSGGTAVRPAAAATDVHYAVDQHLCSQHVRRGYLTCFAMRRVPATRSTPGAVAYEAPSLAKGPAGGYTPADIATAYGVNPSGGRGQTVAVIDAYDDPYALTELNRFDRHYGLPVETSRSFRKVNQSGGSRLPSADASWSGEIALDLQAVRGLCHKCSILLVEASEPSSRDLATAVNTAARLGADEISNSYGGPEAYGSGGAVQRAYNHPGVVITASTGDHGWYDWDYANDVPGGHRSWKAGASDNMPNTPAAYRSVIAVGGTQLVLNWRAGRTGEYVWNDNGPDDRKGLNRYLGWRGDNGASGGGCSFRYAAPYWQHSVANFAGTGCGRKRMTGDVAAVADPNTGYDIYSRYNGGWNTFGGTSLASPLVAAIFALAGGAGGQAYPARSLYLNYEYGVGRAYDVHLGGNAFCAGDDKANCSSVLNKDVGDPNFDGNPNNLLNGSGQHDAENPPQGDGWAGLLDCGYNYDGTAGTLPNDAQCNARRGYDGPSGLGAPHGRAFFRHSNPSVTISRPRVVKAGTRATFRAVVQEPISQAHIVKYTWRFGDGTSATGVRVHHTFHHLRSYRVRVVVNDSLHQTGRGTTRVAVQHR